MDQFPTDPMSANLSEDPTHQRSAARDSLLLSAQLRIAGEPEATVRVRNLSAGGLMAEYAQPVDIGSTVQVDVRGVGWVGGRVAWTAEGRIGIAFDREIYPMAARKPVGNGTHTPRYAKATETAPRPARPLFKP
ncbi:PilZ domain-containing protein [Sphingomonas koreensis]|nr:PilZ domain-containing protein [Sphingomonas koreensis]RSU60563.1 PilZ domain-containing protein [Sphingomonas koreensis]RSU69454.1 PilZ domain-containing protein [Sphingomonas koreensis]